MRTVHEGVVRTVLRPVGVGQVRSELPIARRNGRSGAARRRSGREARRGHLQGTHHHPVHGTGQGIRIEEGTRFAQRKSFSLFHDNPKSTKKSFVGYHTFFVFHTFKINNSSSTNTTILIFSSFLYHRIYRVRCVEDGMGSP